ncbi:MAG: hypothetical protein ACRDKY_08050 [Solirubrobacteraceae bacterium]
MAELTAVAWLAILGLAALVVGGHDAVVGTEINVRLVGSLLFGVGVMLLTGAVGLLHRRPVGLSLAMIAALLGVAVGVMTTLTQIVNDEPDERLIAWIAIVVVSAASAIYIRRLTPPQERMKSIWSRLPILKSAISIGLVFSILQFWYSQIYVPTTAPPSLTLEAKIDKITPRGDQLVVQGSVVARNTSDTKVQVLASTLDLTGLRLAPVRLTHDEFVHDVGLVDRQRLGSADRHIEERADRIVVSHAQLVDPPPGSEAGTQPKALEPGETITVPLLTWVPRGTYNGLELKAWITVGRGKALGLDEAKTAKPASTETGVLYLTRLPEAGWLRRLTRGDRYLRVEYASEPDSYPLVEFDADRAPGASPGFDQRLRRFYGVATTESNDEVALP